MPEKKNKNPGKYPSVVGLQQNPVSFPMGEETLDEENVVERELKEREAQQKEKRETRNKK